jgi:hypothetical protein
LFSVVNKLISLQSVWGFFSSIDVVQGKLNHHHIYQWYILAKSSAKLVSKSLKATWFNHPNLLNVIYLSQPKSLASTLDSKSSIRFSFYCPENLLSLFFQRNLFYNYVLLFLVSLSKGKAVTLNISPKTFSITSCNNRSIYVNKPFFSWKQLCIKQR